MSKVSCNVLPSPFIRNRNVNLNISRHNCSTSEDFSLVKLNGKLNIVGSLFIIRVDDKCKVAERKGQIYTKWVVREAGRHWPKVGGLTGGNRHPCGQTGNAQKADDKYIYFHVIIARKE